MTAIDYSKVLGDKAYEVGFEYEKTHRGCGQSTLEALQDVFDVRDDAIYKALTGIAGGAGMLCDVGCGAYIGGVIFIGSLLGRTRDNIADPEGVRFKTHELVQRLHARFIAEYGTVICRDIHMRLYGRYFYILDREEFAKLDKAGAHETGCTGVVGKACRWVAEMVVQEKLVPEEKLAALVK